jgi:hypothetical protein
MMKELPEGLLQALECHAEAPMVRRVLEEVIEQFEALQDTTERVQDDYSETIEELE